MKTFYSLLVIAIIAGGGYWYYHKHSSQNAIQSSVTISNQNPLSESSGMAPDVAKTPHTGTSASTSISSSSPASSATKQNASTNISTNTSTQNSKTDIKVSTNSSSSGSAPTTGDHVVTITNFAFSPQTITVKAGDTVAFINNDSVEHSVTADNGTFDLSFSNGKATISMSNSGTYTYHCKIHPKMTGTIIWQ